LTIAMWRRRDMRRNISSADNLVRLTNIGRRIGSGITINGRRGYDILIGIF
jgi:hypothetical protein